MAGKTEDMNKLHCSFCGKTQDQVKKLIAGPNVYICDECIDLCSDIIEEEYDVLANKDENFNVPKPKEIKETLDEYVIGRAEQNRLWRLRCITTINAFIWIPRQRM